MILSSCYVALSGDFLVMDFQSPGKGQNRREH